MTSSASRAKSLALAILSTTLSLPGSIAYSATIPPVRGATFSGVEVQLPEDLHQRIAIFVIGFSRNSRDAVTLWGKKLAVDYDNAPSVAYYEMPVLASVPKFLRGFVQDRIRDSVSERGRPHFLPIMDHESDWRTLVHYSDPDTPYIVIADGQGTIRWLAQGPPSDATYLTLQHEVQAAQQR